MSSPLDSTLAQFMDEFFAQAERNVARQAEAVSRADQWWPRLQTRHQQLIAQAQEEERRKEFEATERVRLTEVVMRTMVDNASQLVTAKSVAASSSADSPSVGVGKIVRIKAALFSELVTHCISTLPYAAIGILAGVDHEPSMIFPFTNTKRSRTDIGMDPDEVDAVIAKLTDTNSRVVGLYRSYPGGAPISSPPESEDTASTDEGDASDLESLNWRISFQEPLFPEVTALAVTAVSSKNVPIIIY